ncbi:hypothetical protein H312_02196, partial [Anncaliia algerae PRA339]
MNGYCCICNCDVPITKDKINIFLWYSCTLPPLDLSPSAIIDHLHTNDFYSLGAHEVKRILKVDCLLRKKVFKQKNIKKIVFTNNNLFNKNKLSKNDSIGSLLIQRYL